MASCCSHRRCHFNYGVVINGNHEKSAGLFVWNIWMRPRLVVALHDILRPEAFDRQHKTRIEGIGREIGDIYRNGVIHHQFQAQIVNLVRPQIVISSRFWNVNHHRTFIAHRKRGLPRGVWIDNRSATCPFRADHHLRFYPVVPSIHFIAIFHKGKPKLGTLS